MLNIILTSYNRPAFVTRAIQSLRRQTCPNWRCYVMDDNSEPETLEAIQRASFGESRIIAHHHQTIEAERKTSSRYAVLINSLLPKLSEGIVGYMCDNVEYQPELVASVLGFFDAHPSAFSGYVNHERDAWSADGQQRYGRADYFSHWNITPPHVSICLSGSVKGLLDHSQVFHRLPIVERWEESIDVVKYGDGVFFDRLIEGHGPLWCIDANRPLTVEHLIA